MLQPVVPGDKISARIGDNRNTQAADLFHHISAETVRVCARRSPVRRSRSRWCDPDVRGRNREDGGRALKRGAPDQLPPAWGWPPDLASSQPASPRVGGERQAHVAVFFKKRLFGIFATGIPLFRPFAVGLRRKSTAGRASKRTCLAPSLYSPYSPITQSYQSTLSSLAGRDCPKRSKGWP